MMSIIKKNETFIIWALYTCTNGVHLIQVLVYLIVENVYLGLETDYYTIVRK